ncbi:MAG: glucan biosynthesis protein, partial [Desulfovibrionaceae bacterium]|nr:glucan biosynthesis protein [Desulfovibrionaceae bacterium]
MTTKQLTANSQRRAGWLTLCIAFLACLGLALGAVTAADAQAQNIPARTAKKMAAPAKKAGAAKSQAVKSAAGKKQAPAGRQAAQGLKADLKKPAKSSGAHKAAAASGKKQAGQEAAPQAAPAVFSFADVERLAGELAAKAYVSPKNETPEFLRRLSYEQWAELRFKEECTFWRSEKLPFELQFFHPGSVYDTPVRIHIVDKGRVQDMAFSQDMFVSGTPELEEKLKGRTLNFAGFRLLYPIKGGIHRDEIASFLGATYFRALSRDAGYGLSALGLSINTAVPGSEEFPNFTEFWIVKPAPGDTSVLIYALMNSPSMTGAYTFEVTPGETTFMDVSCTLFERNSARGGR